MSRINHALHLTPAQLCDLLNYLHGWAKLWQLSVYVVRSWHIRRRLEVERWADGQLALHALIPVEALGRMTAHNRGGRHPGELLPRELDGFQFFRHQVWKKWPRSYQREVA
jgi:hypothetical protein